MKTINISGKNGSLDIIVEKRRSYTSTDFWDANWLKCKVMVRDEKKVFSLKINLRTDEFQRFRNLLDNGKTNLYPFRTLEEGLSFDIIRGSTQGLEIVGNLESFEDDLFFEFHFPLDDDSIFQLTQDIDALLKEMPVLGKA